MHIMMYSSSKIVFPASVTDAQIWAVHNRDPKVIKVTHI